MVITTVTTYFTHQITALRDDKNHTRWSSPPPHHTAHIKLVLSDDKSHTMWLSGLPHQSAHIKPQSPVMIKITPVGHHYHHTILHTSNHSPPMIIKTTLGGYHHSHTILHTSNHSSYDDTNHTSWSHHHTILHTSNQSSGMTQTTPAGHYHHHTTPHRRVASWSVKVFQMY